MQEGGSPMAGRSGGMVVFAAISSILVVVLFVLTVVFYFQAQAAQREVAGMEQANAEFIRPAERAQDEIRQLLSSAKTDGKSLVGYLVESRREIMRRVTGTPTDSLERLNQRLSNVPGADSSPLLRVAEDAIARGRELESRLAQANAALERAQQDAANEIQRVAAIESSFRQTIDRLSAEVANYRQEVEALRQDYGQARLSMDRRVEQIRTQADDRVSILANQLDQARADLRAAEEQLRQLRGQSKGTGVRPRPEESLADGVVVAVNERDRQVTINRGAKDKVTLGMTFAVYDDAQQITPDQDGNYPRGKANIEVIRVLDDRAIARINGAVAGRPILKGDVIANAVYDPNKVYTFVVYGFFDADGDGVETFGEARAIEAAIRRWNGTVVDDLSGSVDFLVLGTRPSLPPEPDITATEAQILQYQEALTRVERYDDLFNTAVSAGIPVLNQNRFYTLVGKPFGDVR
ncbi:MAG: hypothetical protein KatS3mg103_0626 [Phycisphaerales bacterium]|nr:MAG: hypothetical protein KatS3mg103_0626 [Phycisphaerales bacterium]